MSEGTRSADQARPMTPEQYEAWKRANADGINEARGSRLQKDPSVISRLRRFGLVTILAASGGAFLATMTGNASHPNEPPQASEGPSDQDKRLSINKILVHTEKPDYVQGRKLIIDFSKINGARDGAYVDNGSDSHPGNLVPSERILEVNGITRNVGEEYEVDNALIVTGANNTGTAANSPYVLLMIRTKDETTPKARFVSLDNTFPGVHYDNKSTSKSSQVKSIRGDEIITTSGPINLRDVNVTISRPAPSPKIKPTP